VQIEQQLLFFSTVVIYNLTVFYSEKNWKGLDSRTSLCISSPLLLVIYRCITIRVLQL
jgi:hypothetical protein